MTLWNDSMTKKDTNQKKIETAIHHAAELIAATKKAAFDYQQHLELEKAKFIDQLILDNLKQQLSDIDKKIKNKHVKGVDLVKEMEVAKLKDAKIPIQRFLDHIQDRIAERDQHIKKYKGKMTGMTKIISADEVYANYFTSNAEKKYYSDSDSEGEEYSEESNADEYATDDHHLITENKSSMPYSYPVISQMKGLVDDQLRDSSYVKALDKKIAAITTLNQVLEASNLTTGIVKPINEVPIVDIVQQEYKDFIDLACKFEDEFKIRRDKNPIAKAFWQCIDRFREMFGAKSTMGITGAKFFDSIHSYFKKHEKEIIKIRNARDVNEVYETRDPKAKKGK